MTQQAANVRCTNLPGGGGWYATTQSVAPYPMDYKWVRVTLKSNNSSAYPVDGNVNNAAQVCWDGTSEKVLNAAKCSLMNPVANPVYLVTALAVSRNGARRMIQQEIAQTPTTGQPGDSCRSNRGCDGDQACGFTEGSCGSEPGTCYIVRGICPLFYAPVCGCDGKDYGNTCKAASAGVSVLHKGGCHDVVGSHRPHAVSAR